MGDGKPVFDKSHGNVGAKADLSVAALAAARVAMWNLKGLDGTRLSLVPQYLIVPPSLELPARQILTPISPTTTGNVNPYAGTLTPIIEPRLEETKSWFLSCSPSQIDTIEFAYLEGRRGPAVETEKAFENDVVKLKVTLDCASKAIDWRGFYKTPFA